MEKLVLPQDFKDLLKLFLDHEVRFLIVGGYAVAFHGYPRFTGDLNILVDNSEINATKIVSSLKEFGFESPNLKTEMFMAKDSLTRMGVEPMKIEIFTHIPGLQFFSSFANAVVQQIEDSIRIPFVSLKDVKASKRASGRAQDIADLDNLP